MEEGRYLWMRPDEFVRKIREEIKELGGEVRFDTKLINIENIKDNNERIKAIKRVKQALTTRKNKLKNNEGKQNFGGYPLLYIFKTVLAGGYKRAIQPKLKASLEDYIYEGLTEEDYNKYK